MAWTEPMTWTPGELVTAAMLNTYVRDNLNALFPVGAYMIRAANYQTVETAVEGRWLQCNGVAVSRTTYVELFNLLNALTPTLPFGPGNGTTTFNLPDLRGRTPYGEGEHANVDLIGDSDSMPIEDRGPHHNHTIQGYNDGAAGTGAVRLQLPSGFLQTGNQGTDGGGATNTPGYLVAGSWFIKYH